VREHGYHPLRVLRRESRGDATKFTELLARPPVDLTAVQWMYAHAISGTISALYVTANWKLQAFRLQQLWEQGPAAVPPPAGGGEEQEMAITCGEVPPLPASAFPAIDAFAQQRSGVVGPFWAWDYEPCSTWPVRSEPPLFRAVGSSHRQPGAGDRQQLRSRHSPTGSGRDVAEAWSGAPAHGGRLRAPALLNASACVNRYEGRYFVSGSFRRRGPDARRTRSRSATELHHWLVLVTLSNGAL
jgi:hypothetical protein